MKKIIFRFWPVIFIFAVWFIFASPYFIKNLAPFPSRYLVTFFPPWSAAYGMPVKNSAMPDVITQIYPWKKFTIDTWKKGEVPLWNPYSFSGTPHAANYQTAVFSPVNLLFFFLPMVDAWSLSVLFQPLLAGLFMYLFLRTLERSREGSLIGSVAFMFCGFLVVWMAYATLGYASLWLPLILWSVHRYMKRSSWWNLATVSTGLALSFFSGHFQISIYVTIASLAFLIFETLIFKKYQSGLKILAFLVFGILLSLPQLLPAGMAYLQSVRSGLFGRGGEIIPWNYLVTIFAPDFYGNPVTRNDWFGHYAEWASFIGVMPLLLAIYSMFRKKDHRQWFFMAAAFIGLMLATPTPLTSLLFQLKIPVLSTSAASRIIVCVSFFLAVLSAFGLDGLVLDWKDGKIKPFFKFLFLITALFIILWSSLIFGKIMPAQWLIVAKRNLILPSVISIFGIILMSLGFQVKNKHFAKFIVIAFVGITAFDMLRYAGKWMPFDQKEFIFPPMAVGNFLQQKAGNDRVFGNVFNEFNGFNFLKSIIGYDAVYQGRYGEFISAATDGKIGKPERSVVNLPKQGLYSEKIMELLGVKYLVHRLSDGRFGWAYPYWNFPFYKSVYKDQYYEVFENSKAIPRAFLASSYKIDNKDQEIIDLMFSPDFNPAETVVLEKRPIMEPQVGPGSVNIANYQANKVSLSVNTRVPKMLFLSDVYDGGWQATVDGKSTPVYRADYDFRAVAVPAGNHNIEFVYNPLSFRIGVLIALAVTLVLIAGSIKQFIF